MKQQIYSIHQSRAGEIEAVGEPDILAAFPTLWAIWHGLPIALVVSIAILLMIPYAPVFFLLTYSLIGILIWMEGGMIERTERWILGWREIGCAEAATREGAIEAFIKQKGQGA